jgi:hypothetical protein
MSRETTSPAIAGPVVILAEHFGRFACAGAN